MNFKELLDHLNVPMADEGHHHARAGWVQFDCPHCSPGSGRWRMGYSLERGSLSCWFCGRHRLWETLIALGVPKSRVKGLASKLRRKAPVDLPKHSGTYKPPKGVGPLAPKHRAYLQGRDMDPDALTRLWGLGGITHSFRYGWRIFVPIMDKGRAVSWTTRSTADNPDLRWLSASEEEEAIPAGQLVYGLEYVRHRAIIHEGPSDVWATGPGSVGMLGVATTNAQILKLSKIHTRVVCYDNSPDAQRRANELCEVLSVFPGETINVQLDTGDDPASADRAEIELLRRTYLEN